MRAHTGYRFLYSACVRKLDREGRIRVDALLGLAGAVEEEQKYRSEQVAVSGFEVG